MWVLLIADQHIGIRNDNMALSEHALSFFEKVVFPIIEKEKISQIIHLGDVFDRRKMINMRSYQMWRHRFFNWLSEKDIKMDIILGNHDVYFRNTNEVNSPTELLNGYYNIEIFDKPITVSRHGKKLFYVPWIPSGEEESFKEICKGVTTDLCFGHFELLGFELMRGVVNTHHGMDANVLKQFKQVYSGHFHRKSSKGNIMYLGSPYQMTWSDHGDIRGCHLLNLETNELVFIPNEEEMFLTIDYKNDTPLEGMEKYTDKYVTCNVYEKEDPARYKQFLDLLYEANPLEIIVNPISITQAEGDAADELVLTKGTVKLIQEYVNDMGLSSGFRDRVKTYLQDLYVEAQNQT